VEAAFYFYLSANKQETEGIFFGKIILLEISPDKEFQ
jgi:hypothetical protein